MAQRSPNPARPGVAFSRNEIRHFRAPGSNFPTSYEERRRFFVGAKRAVLGRRSAPAYWGNVATGGRIANANAGSAGARQMMSRSPHVARDNIGALKIVLPGWFTNTSRVDTNAANSVTYRASIEYPSGTFTQLLFSGSASGTCTAGSELVSDIVSVQIPNGARFWVRIWQNAGSGLLTYIELDTSNGVCDYQNGEQLVYGATVTDVTMGGTITPTNPGTQAALCQRPLAILAWTRKPTLLILGDSREWGFKDTYDGVGGSGDIGVLARACGPYWGYCCASIGGETAQNMAGANAAKRIALQQYHSHVLTEMAVADIYTGRTLAQVQGNLATLWANFPTKKLYHRTGESETTSTDNWATTGNQTLISGTAVWLTYHNWLLSNPSPLTGVLDLAPGAIDIATQKWRVTGSAFGYTLDGVHGSQLGFKAALLAGFVGPNTLKR